MVSPQLAPPQTILGTGVPKALLQDLATKIIAQNSDMSLLELAKRLCLESAVVEEIFQFVRKEQLCEVKGMVAGTYRIAVTEHGRKRATELLSVSQYTGPAPVSLAEYSSRVRVQSTQKTTILDKDLVGALQHLVLQSGIVTRLGIAMTSGTALFLYGPSGCGKSSVAGSVAAAYRDDVWIPYAIEVDNQIITVYDSGVHTQSDPGSEQVDKRWVCCKRPLVTVGGELTHIALELQFNPANRYCDAPLHMKANNGVFIVDDFGRQHIRPAELLNRWMTLLERQIEYLSLPGGRKFTIPFDVFVVFATNVDPSRLADEAFLRRIPNKIKLDYATTTQFQEIFRQACAELSLNCDEVALDYLIRFITTELKRPLCPCYPRDLMRQISWAAAYRREEFRVDKQSLEEACRNYFLETAKPQGIGESCEDHGCLKHPI
jgi:predicted ATPase with chaperone activity